MEDKIYLGKPENQRDQKAVNAHKPTQSKPDPKPKDKPVDRPLPKTDPSPPNTNHRTGDPFAESIFGRGLSVREVNSRTTFSPSLVASVEISRSVFQQLKTDDVQLTKQLTPEFVDYYHTFCIWARIVHLKNKNQEVLTPEEDWLLDVIRNREYTLLGPISVYLRGIGNIVTLTGQHLYPDFPALPTSTVGGKTGFYGAISIDNHNLYEEIPCFGVLAEAIQYAVSASNPGVRPSVLNVPNSPVNGNLLGFKPLQNRRLEAKDLALSSDITSEQFHETRQHTAINLRLINAISDILAGTKTFRVSHVNFSTMSINGSQTQIIETKRTGEIQPGSDVNSEVQPQCLIKEKDAHFGSAIYCGFQLEKSVPTENWLSFTLPNPIPANYPDYAGNRNIRHLILNV